MAKLFFIGDSITAGAWDGGGGWVTRLNKQILKRTHTTVHKSKGFYCMPYNLGVSGDTVADLVRRFDREVTARTYGQAVEDTVQIVFAAGVNDSVFLINENRNHASDSVFEEDIMALIIKARAVTDNITFSGLLPVDESLTNPCPWNSDVAYRNKNIQNFNNIFRNICKREGLDFIDHFDEWSAMKNLSNYFTDGLHPNDQGHEKLAQKIGDVLFNDAFTNFHTK